MESNIHCRTIYLKGIEFNSNQTVSSNLNISFHFLPNKMQNYHRGKKGKQSWKHLRYSLDIVKKFLSCHTNKSLKYTNCVINKAWLETVN